MVLWSLLMLNSFFPVTDCTVDSQCGANGCCATTGPTSNRRTGVCVCGNNPFGTTSRDGGFGSNCNEGKYRACHTSLIQTSFFFFKPKIFTNRVNVLFAQIVLWKIGNEFKYHFGNMVMLCDFTVKCQMVQGILYVTKIN